MDPRALDIARAIDELSELEVRLLAFEDEHAGSLARVAPRHVPSARNLLHYIRLRQQDIRELQECLQSLGLSSLGRAESHVMGNVRSVLDVLYRLRGEVAADGQRATELPAFGKGPEVLRARTDDLLGERPQNRAGRIMVTMPSEAADDPCFIAECLVAGMNCMRINCAHDDAGRWARMIQHLHAARERTGLRCRVFMDLGGPKLRTGAVADHAPVLRWKPDRDRHGRAVAPARIWITPWQAEATPPAEPAAVLRMPAYWLAAARPGDRIDFVDARGEERSIRVLEAVNTSFWGLCSRTAYVTPQTRFVLLRRGRTVNSGRGSRAAAYGIQPEKGSLVVRCGDRLTLNAVDMVTAPRSRSGWGTADIPRLSCTLPEALAAVRTGESVWFDDGKVSSIVRAVREHEVEVEITWARGGEARIQADRGINLPDTDLQLPALTNRDLEDLHFVAAHADLVGMSWVQNPRDVDELLLRLRALGAEHVGVVLKIETRRGFEALPELLLAAMQDRAVGVMIARGDLAVECGWEQLAEIQEQILWLCEAAHVPVIWATQVLESLAKTGRPSRAEITDAAMSGRAECVMLNKGPHVVEAIRVLDRILERMAGHQSKRSPRLPKLRVWRQYAGLTPVRSAVHGLVAGDAVSVTATAGTSRMESISE